MANGRTIGSRSVNLKAFNAKTVGSKSLRSKPPVMSKLSLADLDQLRAEGHKVFELPGGFAEVSGRRFKVIGRPVEQPAPARSFSVIEADPLHGKDVGGSGRNELTDFG